MKNPVIDQLIINRHNKRLIAAKMLNFGLYAFVQEESFRFWIIGQDIPVANKRIVLT